MNSKLKLDLEDLAVDSFDTTRPAPRLGTVFGEQCTCYTNCTCPGCPTCYASCNGSCDASCNGTCGATCDNTCNYSCAGQETCAGCDTQHPCTTAQYSNCGRIVCY